MATKSIGTRPVVAGTAPLTNATPGSDAPQSTVVVNPLVEEVRIQNLDYLELAADNVAGTGDVDIVASRDLTSVAGNIHHTMVVGDASILFEDVLNDAGTASRGSAVRTAGWQYLYGFAGAWPWEAADINSGRVYIQAPQYVKLLADTYYGATGGAGGIPPAAEKATGQVWVAGAGIVLTQHRVELHIEDGIMIGADAAGGGFTADKVGFFGATPVVRPDVAHDATVATLITVLDSLGIINKVGP